MEEYLKNWKSFILSESLANYNIGGKVVLYHFSQAPADKVLLDPEYFLSKRNYYSRNDYNVSGVPRIFFYLNLDQAEHFVSQGAELFSTVVSADEIYNLVDDPLGLKRKSMSQYRVGVDFDKILKNLSGAEENMPEDSLLSYNGVYYQPGGMDVVAWFKPIEVTRHDSRGDTDEN